MRRFALSLALLIGLTGCVGVIDNCHKGLDPPPGGWTSPQRQG